MPRVQGLPPDDEALLTCPTCGHDENLHLHIAEGGCAGTFSSKYIDRMLTHSRCGCTRNPRHVAAELDDPSEEVIARGEARDAQERSEDERG